jgi:hypothetical protein
MLTGTRDSGLDGDWRTRLAAFEGLPPGHKRLAIIAGATHLALGGRGDGAVAESSGRVVAAFLRELALGWKQADGDTIPRVEIRNR